MLHRDFLGLGLAHLFERDGRERAVVEHIHVVEQVKALEHHADVLAEFIDIAALGREVLAMEPDMARVRGLEQVEAAQEGRLTRARGADDGDDLAGINGQVDALEYLERAKALAQALNADERLFGLRGRSAGSNGICHDDSPRLAPSWSWAVWPEPRRRAFCQRPRAGGSPQASGSGRPRAPRSRPPSGGSTRRRRWWWRT